MSTTNGSPSYGMTGKRWIVMFLVIMLVTWAAVALIGTVLAPG